MEVAVFSFGRPHVVVVQTFTSSTQFQSTGPVICNEILLPYVRLFRGAMGLQFLFMDDNALCHRTVAAEQLLERLAARTLPPVMIRELRLTLQDEWAAMRQQQLIDTLILSMRRRCETCLAVRRSYPLLRDRMFFLLDTHHRDVSACSRIVLHATFFNQASFIPLISLLEQRALTKRTHTKKGLGWCLLAEMLYLVTPVARQRSAMLGIYDESVIKEYCEDDALLILPAGLGPVETGRMN
ncbi:transposable element Tc3 transposase [Trichonephila clavipes]|nr:transposable element Tc3 transposase [Trichonephila clavipes]